MSDESRRPTGDESRIFWVNSDSDHPSTSRDEKTVLGLSVNDVLPSTTRMPLREQFTKHYVQIREWLTAHAERPGVTLLAMSADALHGAAFLAAKPDLVSTATIGRHSKADLRLKDDASLSLRHVALLLFPYQTPVRGCRYRLLDLRSATAFVDERGKRLRALEADGPAFVRVGNYTLLAFATIGVNALWPDDPDAGWAQIPARLYLDEVETDEKSNQWEAESDKAWEVDDLPSVSSSPNPRSQRRRSRDGGPRARRRDRNAVWRAAHYLIAWCRDSHPRAPRRAVGGSAWPLPPLRCRQSSVGPNDLARASSHHRDRGRPIRDRHG